MNCLDLYYNLCSHDFQEVSLYFSRAHASSIPCEMQPSGPTPLGRGASSPLFLAARPLRRRCQLAAPVTSPVHRKTALLLPRRTPCQPRGQTGRNAPRYGGYLQRNRISPASEAGKLPLCQQLLQLCRRPRKQELLGIAAQRLYQLAHVRGKRALPLAYGIGDRQHRIAAMQESALALFPRNVAFFHTLSPSFQKTGRGCAPALLFYIYVLHPLKYSLRTELPRFVHPFVGILAARSGMIKPGRGRRLRRPVCGYPRGTFGRDQTR